VSSVAVRQEVTRREAEPVAKLFADYSERLLGYCQRWLGNRSEAEDAVQTTFLYAHRALQRGVVPESEAAWLFTIAKNVCRWQHRTGSRHPTVAGDLDLDDLAHPESFEEENRDLLRELDAALAAIPERQRDALLLREWRGLSCPEIASQLHMSAPATHALLTRARRSLASAMTAARPVVCLDFGGLLLQFRRLLAGTSAKVATTAVVVVGVGVTGVAVQRTLDADRPAARTPAPAVRSAGFDQSGPIVNSGPGPQVATQRRGAVTPSSGGTPRADRGSTRAWTAPAVATRADTKIEVPAVETRSGQVAPGTPVRSASVPVLPDPEGLPDLTDEVPPLPLPVEAPPLPEIELPSEVLPPDLAAPPLPEVQGAPDVEVSLPPPVSGVPDDVLPGLLP
jgi:RNA polymerase sigma factor (sigma-70 family)